DDVRTRLTAFQRKHGVLDPTAQAMANSGLTAELQAELARREAELKGLLAYLNDDAPQSQALQAQISGLRTQLDAERLRGLTTDEGKSLDRKSTRLNSSHVKISYAVFCLKKKTSERSTLWKE